MLYFLVVMDFVALVWVVVPTQVFGMHGKDHSSLVIVYHRCRNNFVIGGAHM